MKMKYIKTNEEFNPLVDKYIKKFNSDLEKVKKNLEDLGYKLKESNDNLLNSGRSRNDILSSKQFEIKKDDIEGLVRFVLVREGSSDLLGVAKYFTDPRVDYILQINGKSSSDLYMDFDKWVKRTNDTIWHNIKDLKGKYDEENDNKYNIEKFDDEFLEDVTLFLKELVDVIGKYEISEFDKNVGENGYMVYFDETIEIVNSNGWAFYKLDTEMFDELTNLYKRLKEIGLKLLYGFHKNRLALSISRYSSNPNDDWDPHH